MLFTLTFYKEFEKYSFERPSNLAASCCHCLTHDAQTVLDGDYDHAPVEEPGLGAVVGRVTHRQTATVDPEHHGQRLSARGQLGGIIREGGKME